jgi:hypothetical protein
MFNKFIVNIADNLKIPILSISGINILSFIDGLGHSLSILLQVCVGFAGLYFTIKNGIKKRG